MLPALLISRLVVAYGDVSAAFSNRNTNHRPRASLHTRVSKTPFARGSTEAACQFPGVVADKQCTCPASKLMWERYQPSLGVKLRARLPRRNTPCEDGLRPPALSSFGLASPPTPPFRCGENEIQASLISSASVGATPTPATSLR